MDFATLKSRVLALIGRAPADVCYELVTADINQSLRILAMESTTTLTEAAEVSLPADFLAVIDIYRDTDPRTALRPTVPQAINRSHVSSGTPTQYAIVNGKLLLNPAPDGSETISLRYYAKLSDLSADTDTNAILTKYPGVYIYGVLTHHAKLIRNIEGAQIWEQQYTRELMKSGASDQSDRHSGAPMVPLAGYVA